MLKQIICLSLYLLLSTKIALGEVRTFACKTNYFTAIQEENKFEGLTYNNFTFSMSVNEEEVSINYGGLLFNDTLKPDYELDSIKLHDHGTTFSVSSIRARAKFSFNNLIITKNEFGQAILIHAVCS